MAQPATAAAGRCRRATDARPRSRDAVQLAVAGDPGRTLSGPLCRQRGARAGGPVAWRGTGRVRRCRARGVAADRGQSRAPGVHAGRDDPSGRPALSRDPRHALRYRFSRPPYRRDLLAPSLDALLRHGWLAPGAAVYLEHEAGIAPPVLPAGWQLHRSAAAGQVRYHLARPEPVKAESS